MVKIGAWFELNCCHDKSKLSFHNYFFHCSFVNPFTPTSDQLQFSHSVSPQRYIIQYGELGICSDES